MIKKLIYLTLASASTLALTGCGESSLESVDSTLMGSGKDNKTGLGGYWWTYVDRSGKSKVEPNTGKVDPMDTTTKPPKLQGSVSPGNGIDDGAFHVKGYVGPEPNYLSEEEADMDRYVDAFYGKGAPYEYCMEESCGEMAYPTAGIGFSFKNKNAPLGNDASDKVGISFRMKLGPDHGTDANDDPQPVFVELPMDLTDVPDPTFEDQFGTAYVAGGSQPNKPFCTFPNSDNGDGEKVGRSDKSCYRNATTQGNTDLALTTEWKTFCLAWDKFDAPPYPPSDFADRIPSVAETKARMIKVQFAAYKPGEKEEAAKFDYFVDDVYLLTQAKWDEVCGAAEVP